MSRFYSDDFKVALKEQADIAQVISQFVHLHPIGGNMMGLCPFHEDKNPSFQVVPSTGTFYCHCCGAGSRNHSRVNASDVYGFLKGILGCNMAEAIEWLASYLGSPLPQEDPQAAHKTMLKGKWYEFCGYSQARFQDNLFKNQEAMKYLSYRGFTANDIMYWGLGYGDDTEYDFRNTKDRLVFSLHDYEGNLISFTGRVIMPDHALSKTNEDLKALNKPIIPKYLDRIGLKKDDPKYANHPYPDFDKRNHLFGMHIAKEYIRKFGVAIIVEGWTDVMMFHRYGAQHTVGTMGVSLSKEHVNLLKRAGAKHVITIRDGDKAGYEAALRDAKALSDSDIQVSIVGLTPGVDPCTLCDQFNMFDDSLNKFINKKAMPLAQYQLKKIFQDTQEEIFYHHAQITGLQGTRIRNILEVIDSITDPIDKDLYIRQASDLFGVSYEAISTHVK